MPDTPNYQIVISEETWRNIRQYQSDILSGKHMPGARLRSVLGKDMRGAQTPDDLLQALLMTKKAQIFAESEIMGDGSDWNAREIALLGDINTAMNVEIFDNGVWSPGSPDFRVHTPLPIQGQLLFTPGALLADRVNSPDLQQVAPKGAFNQKAYNSLVERRLLPLLLHASDAALAEKRPALITLPGIGCGAFAGAHRGLMGDRLNDALQDMLNKYSPLLQGITCIYFDPFNECQTETQTFGGINYRVRPSAHHKRPQLGAPKLYEEDGDDFSSARLYKIVAWDHVSLPGNDFFKASRFTDDGVSAAATDSMRAVTGVKGAYHKGYYMPPAPCAEWDDVVSRNGVYLRAEQNNTRIFAHDGTSYSMAEYERKIAGNPATSAPRHKPD